MMDGVVPVVAARLRAAVTVTAFPVPKQDGGDVHAEKLALENGGPSDDAVAEIVAGAVVRISMLIENADTCGAIEQAMEPLHQSLLRDKPDAVLDERLDVERQKDVHFAAALEDGFRKQHVATAGE